MFCFKKQNIYELYRLCQEKPWDKSLLHNLFMLSTHLAFTSYSSVCQPCQSLTRFSRVNHHAFHLPALSFSYSAVRSRPQAAGALSTALVLSPSYVAPQAFVYKWHLCWSGIRLTSSSKPTQWPFWNKRVTPTQQTLSWTSDHRTTKLMFVYIHPIIHT